MFFMNPKWVFLRKKDLGMRNIDPAEDYFFEELPPLGAVIRESTQNSLPEYDGRARVFHGRTRLSTEASRKAA